MPLGSPSIRAALITSDDAFRSHVAATVRQPDRGVSVVTDLSAPFTKLTDDQIQELRAADPELVFLDLEADPVLGLKFAQFLLDQAPERKIVATGPMLSSDLLLSALRAGVAEYLPKPVSPEGLGSAVDGLVRKLRRNVVGMPTQPGRLLALFSAKGGSGSTTIATNLAIQLHRLTGKRVLLADLDLELGEIALQLGVEPRFNFVDMVRNFHRMDAELLASYIEHHSSGVHLLSAPYVPERAELVTGDQIAKILRFLKQHYEYVIVDTSKSFAPATLATFEQSDQIYLVTVADLPSLRNISRCLPILQQMTGSAEGRVRLIMNRFQEDNLITPEDVERTLGLKVFWTVANDYEAVMQSINTGSPIILNGTSQYAKDVKDLAGEIAGLSSGPPTPKPAFMQKMVAPLRRVLERNRAPEAEVKA